jgi:hypothetical protein
MKTSPYVAAEQSGDWNRWACVVVRVANRRENVSRLDAAFGCVRTFDLKRIVSAISGRKVSEFGTVRPRVQIPGPRPNFVFRPSNEPPLRWRGPVLLLPYSSANSVRISDV